MIVKLKEGYRVVSRKGKETTPASRVFQTPRDVI